MTPRALSLLKHLRALDKALQDQGYPAISPWWWAQIKRWYAGAKKQAVFRVGRRGGKSTSMVRVAVCEALFGEHKIPPGDIGVVAVVSARRDDAMERLRTIASILDALGVEYIQKGDTIELPGRNVMFRVFTASVAGVSGFTTIFALCDEVSKWRDSDTGANPAREVLAGLRPTLATQKEARIALISSPMGFLDAHAEAFALGDTAFQMTAHAPTWVANPTLTEQETRDLETDDLIWQREYAAIPQAEDVLSLLSQPDLDYACAPDEALSEHPCDRHVYVAAMDPATRGNAWTLAVATRTDADVRQVVLAREWRGSRTRPLVITSVLREIRDALAPFRLKHVYTDQFAVDAIRELAIPLGLAIVPSPWNLTNKAEAYENLKTQAQAKKLKIPDEPVLKTDLFGIRVKLTRSGIVYELAEQGPRHSDYAPAVAKAILEAKVQALPKPTTKTEGELHDLFKAHFLLQRKRERERADTHGRLPITHQKLRVP